MNPFDHLYEPPFEYSPLMKPVFEHLLNDPPLEDSPDLTEEEVAQAIGTTSVEDLVAAVKRKLTPGEAVARYELRRQGENLYFRVRLAADRVLTFRTNWLGV